MGLTNEQASKIFAINVVEGKNLRSDYEESAAKAEGELKSGKCFEQVKDEIREDLKSKYPR